MLSMDGHNCKTKDVKNLLNFFLSVYIFSEHYRKMSGNTRFQCKLCEFACSEFAEILDHIIISHPSNELSFRKHLERASLLVVLGFNATLTSKVISWRSVTHMCFLAFSHQY